MTLVTELERLADLHRHGDLSGEEFEAAKRHLLLVPGSSETQPVEAVAARDELTRLDIDWLQAQPKLWPLRGRPPTEADTTWFPWIMYALAALSLVAGLSFMNSRRGPASGFALVVGAVTIVIAAVVSQQRARRYLEAERMYRRRRDKLQDKIEATEGPLDATSISIRPTD
ncbi:MAG: SHOCT domain-containing protein [Planctomycetes bacterium]|nr:SHOCT domain-containing protein [Planctomycetota bacterium]